MGNGKVTDPVKPCPKTFGAIVASVTRTDKSKKKGTAGKPLKNVRFVLVETNAQKKSGGSGAAEFSKLPPKSYTVTAALADDQTTEFELVSTSQSVVVTPKSKVKAQFQAARLASACVHVLGEGANRPGVHVKITGPKTATVDTNAQGVADFGQVPIGKYTVTVTFTPGDDNDKGFTAPTTAPTFTLARSDQLTTDVTLVTKKPTLKVKIHKKGDPATVFENAKVTVTGPESPGGIQTAAGTGLSDHGALKAGTYTIRVALDAEHLKTHAPPPDLTGYALGPGQDLTVIIEVEPVVVITPVVALEYNVVLLDRKLVAHQPGTETKHPAHATYALLSLTQDLPTLKYTTKGAKLSSEPADKIEVYEDEALTKKLDLAKPIANAKLTGTDPYKVFIKGVAKGKLELKLTLEDPADGRFKAADKPAVEKMAVVDLQFKLHRFETSDLLALEVDPDTGTIADYNTRLQGKALPDQKALTDEAKVKEGRVLHVQDGKNAGRAKLLLEKLVADDWPDGTDDYKIVFRASKSSDETQASAAITAFDAEIDGTEKTLPCELKVKDLRAADTILWIEGKDASKKAVDVRLDVGIDRDAGGAAAKPKRNGDWAHFTVVKIKEVKVDYTPVSGQAAAWEERSGKFFVNLKAGDDGRKITIRATLTEKIKDIPIHFALAPDKDNMKAANWGKDLPAGWVWKDVAAAVKHKDRSDRKKVLHTTAKTDEADGKATAELLLSRFGGDKLTPAAYIQQDPHLAKYVHGDTELEKRKPTLSTKTVIVWRKFWYQEVKVTGITVAGFGNAADTYKDVKVDMVAATVVEMPRATANAIVPKVIYPKHMLSYYFDSVAGAYKNNYPGDTGDGLAVGDATEARFFALSTPATDKPVMIPMLNAHGLWIADGNAGALNPPSKKSTAYPLSLNTDKKLLDPPLQGGTLFVSGTWEARDWDPAAGGGAGGFVNPRTGNLASGDVALDPNRSGPRAVNVKLPAAVVVATGPGKYTNVKVKDLVLRGSSSFLGTSYRDGIVNSYTPNDVQDFINTINHELGHSFSQVAKVVPTGAPAHPHQYDKNGSHCDYTAKKCVMYESGPQPGSLNRYCEVCHPYVLVQEFRK
jgi:hypothetical protein